VLRTLLFFILFFRFVFLLGKSIQEKGTCQRNYYFPIRPPVTLHTTYKHTEDIEILEAEAALLGGLR
jgi:hypothetical protein